MLNLYCETPTRWLSQVDTALDEILIDHAHCEKKAASTALNLLGSYIEDEEVCRTMTEIVNEELDHFHQVLELLKRRGITFKRLKPSGYGRKLIALIRKQEPQRGVDRMLVAALIEARSCERFSKLRDYVQDEELRDFYGSLFESEARHHATYVRLAKRFAPDEEVDVRLAWLAEEEAAIIMDGDERPRMHS